MSLWNKYPYLDEHELNLDWIIAKMRELQIEFDEFKVVNQIGFSGAWDITKQYPAWTIVDDGGMGYISTQPVPAGVLISNTNYWQLIADYSVVVAGLATRVSNLESTVGDASSGLVHDNTQNQADIATLQTDVSDINARDFFQNREILILGDSLSDEGIARFQPNWVSHFRTKVASSNCNITNYSFGGRTLSNVDVNNLIDDLANIPAGSYTDIILFLGINDWTENATIAQFTSACSSFKTWVQSTYPDALVHVITPLKSSWNTAQTPLMLYRLLFLKQFVVYGFNIIDAFADAPFFNGNDGFLKNRWSGDNLGTHDGLHINPDYAPYFAEFVYRRMQTLGTGSVTDYVDSVQVTNFFNSVALNLYLHESGKVSLYLNLGSYTPGSTLVTLGTIPAWACPIFEQSQFCYTGGNTYAEIIIKTSGAAYLLMPNTNNMPTCSPYIDYYLDPFERASANIVI